MLSSGFFFFKRTGTIRDVKKISLLLAHAGWSDMNFWMNQPIRSLGGWIKLIKELVKAHRR